MVRQKVVANRGKGKAPVSSSGQTPEIVREMEEEEEMIADQTRGRSKRRTLAERRAAKQKKWEVGIPGRGFKNDRHVDVDNLGIENPFVVRTRNQGLAYYLGPNRSYNKDLVIEFYQNIRVPDEENEGDENAVITSKIGRIPIKITKGFIARFLGYHQPSLDEENYVASEYVADETNIKDLYKDPSEASLPHVPGGFKDVYRLVNQFVHHNINPRGTENKPDITQGGMIHAFMNPTIVINWVSYIFQEMIDFKSRAPANSRMPFPCLVTAMCFVQNVPESKFAKKEKLNPGDINRSILRKSISQSRPVIAAPPRGAYLTTLPPKGSKTNAWNKLLFCQGVATMSCMKKLKKETRDNARRQRKIDHKLDWMMSHGMAQPSEPYVPPAEEPDVDSDDFAGDEPEFLDNE